jgi:hypothetical protein
MPTLVQCLDPGRKLAHVPSWRWRRFVADYEEFVDSDWFPKVAALGWSEVQLFGCHRDMPWVCNWWGALWFVAGGTIDDISHDIIYVTSVRGLPQSISRMRHAYEFLVPVWDVPMPETASVQAA